MQHLDQKELAERWRISARTLERWRRDGSGPRFLKLGGRCIYAADEVERFEQAHLKAKTQRQPGSEGENTEECGYDRA